MTHQAYALDQAVLEICNDNFEMDKDDKGKLVGDCGKCPIKQQCLKEFTLKKMGTLGARNAALNEYVAGMDS